MLYKGSIIKKFIIDRLAMGYSYQAIAEMFKKEYDDEITIEFISGLFAENEEEIRQREESLLKELAQNSVSIEGRLESLYSEVRGVLDELKKDRNWKHYSSVLNSLLKNIELLAKSLGRLKNNNSGESKILIQKNNYKSLILMAEDGILSIKDKKKLKKLLGIEEDEENEEGREIYA